MSLRQLIQRPIEIEDQLVPKRAHHHAGIEHMIPMELMAAKVKEAVAARRNPDFLIVARTNAIRASSMDDALRRGDAYKKAGADLVLAPGDRAGDRRERQAVTDRTTRG
jgi:2-methylisocitrate lyase-like PEP mutase family enzyme